MGLITDPESFGLHRMTKKAIVDSCKKNKLYITPELNDVLYLHFQGYQKIEELDAYTGLKCLWLESNAITQISGLENQKLLKCLFLHNNLIQKIENLEACRELDTVNLSYNQISHLSNVGSDILPVLNTLNLANNYLRSAENIEVLKTCLYLSVLDLSNNRLDDILIVKIFSEMPELKVLILTGNPVINEIPSYRKTMIVECKKLTYLDSRPVFPKDRAFAEAWKRGGFPEEKREIIRWNKAERREMLRSVNATLKIRNRGGGEPALDLIPTDSSDDDEDYSHDMRTRQCEDIKVEQQWNVMDEMIKNPDNYQNCTTCGSCYCQSQHNIQSGGVIDDECLEPEDILGTSNLAIMFKQLIVANGGNEDNDKLICRPVAQSKISVIDECITPKDKLETSNSIDGGEEIKSEDETNNKSIRPEYEISAKFTIEDKNAVVQSISEKSSNDEKGDKSEDEQIQQKSITIEKILQTPTDSENMPKCKKDSLLSISTDILDDKKSSCETGLNQQENIIVTHHFKSVNFNEEEPLTLANIIERDTALQYNPNDSKEDKENCSGVMLINHDNNVKLYQELDSMNQSNVIKVPNVNNMESETAEDDKVYDHEPYSILGYDINFNQSNVVNNHQVQLKTAIEDKYLKAPDQNECDPVHKADDDDCSEIRTSQLNIEQAQQPWNTMNQQSIEYGNVTVEDLFESERYESLVNEDLKDGEYLIAQDNMESETAKGDKVSNYEPCSILGYNINFNQSNVMNNHQIHLENIPEDKNLTAVDIIQCEQVNKADSEDCSDLRTIQLNGEQAQQPWDTMNQQSIEYGNVMVEDLLESERYVSLIRADHTNDEYFKAQENMERDTAEDDKVSNREPCSILGYNINFNQSNIKNNHQIQLENAIEDKYLTTAVHKANDEDCSEIRTIQLNVEQAQQPWNTMHQQSIEYGNVMVEDLLESERHVPLISADHKDGDDDFSQVVCFRQCENIQLIQQFEVLPKQNNESDNSMDEEYHTAEDMIECDSMQLLPSNNKEGDRNYCVDMNSEQIYGVLFNQQSNMLNDYNFENKNISEDYLASQDLLQYDSTVQINSTANKHDIEDSSFQLCTAQCQDKLTNPHSETCSFIEDEYLTAEEIIDCELAVQVITSDGNDGDELYSYEMSIKRYIDVELENSVVYMTTEDTIECKSTEHHIPIGSNARKDYSGIMNQYHNEFINFEDAHYTSQDRLDSKSDVQFVENGSNCENEDETLGNQVLLQQQEYKINMNNEADNVLNDKYLTPEYGVESDQRVQLITSHNKDIGNVENESTKQLVPIDVKCIEYDTHTIRFDVSDEFVDHDHNEFGSEARRDELATNLAIQLNSTTEFQTTEDLIECEPVVQCIATSNKGDDEDQNCAKQNIEVYEVLLNQPDDVTHKHNFDEYNRITQCEPAVSYDLLTEDYNEFEKVVQRFQTPEDIIEGELAAETISRDNNNDDEGYNREIRSKLYDDVTNQSGNVKNNIKHFATEDMLESSILSTIWEENNSIEWNDTVRNSNDQSDLNPVDEENLTQSQYSTNRNDGFYKLCYDDPNSSLEYVTIGNASVDTVDVVQETENNK